MKTPIARTTKRLHSWSLVGGRSCYCLITLVSLGFLLLPDAAAGQKGPAQPGADNSAAKRPVIMLTGFEPFGKGRPPNPSWEGIKKLDGTEWKGYQLVCKELPVVWGAPLEHLQGWISQYQPVAIFSFGQGGKGAFAVESRAYNARSPKAADNQNKRAPTPMIVEDGPSFYYSSIDCEKFAHYLAEKGYKTRVSTLAGRYLCEECLYTLEYLKTTKQLDATVMFCHVPPLNSYLRTKPSASPKPHLFVPLVGAPASAPAGTPLGSLLFVYGGLNVAELNVLSPVTADYVQEFVQDVLETWRLLYKSAPSNVPAEPKDQGKPTQAREQDVKDVKEFIGRYFSTWSNQDMKGYDACFLPDACIQHIDARGNLTTSSRPDFIASQREYHRTAPYKTTEVAETVDIRFEEKLARVVVYWKLTAGPRIDYGYDHFTLIKHNGNWRIVNLVFYGVPSAKKIKKPA